MSRDIKYIGMDVHKEAALRRGSHSSTCAIWGCNLLVKAMMPEMARLTLARKIAALALTFWKKEERFDPEQLKPQAA